MRVEIIVRREDNRFSSRLVYIGLYRYIAPLFQPQEFRRVLHTEKKATRQRLASTSRRILKVLKNPHSRNRNTVVGRVDVHDSLVPYSLTMIVELSSFVFSYLYGDISFAY